MMKTVSLETAKLLKEAGWKQRKTEQHWYIYKGKTPKIDIGLSVSKLDFLQKKDWDCFAAPDVSELLEDIYAQETHIRLFCIWDGGWSYQLFGEKGWKDEVNGFDSPVEAVAHAWLTLKKQGLLEKGRERV